MPNHERYMLEKRRKEERKHMTEHERYLRDKCTRLGLLECPVCSGNMYNVSKADKTCHMHINLIITVCPDCNRPYFSDVPGLCDECSIGKRHYEPNPT